MRAIVSTRYGSADDLKLQEVGEPVVDAESVLVRVRAASVNPYDWHFMRGEPYFLRVGIGLRRPRQAVRGVDVAGYVEAIGEMVRGFGLGDEVFGVCRGAFAEYACGEAGKLVPKPVNLTFEQAAAVPLAGVTALQAVRDGGRLESGQSVLVNGAAGGVGTFSVQIAKAFGGNVTGVCSTANVDLVRSMGVDHVVDYTVEDFTRGGERYDLVVDTVGNRSLADLRRATTPKGTIVLVGGAGGRILGPLPGLPWTFLVSRFISQRMVLLVAKVRGEDLVALKELAQAGKVTPVIDRTYSLGDAPEAIRHVERGHARGKVVISV